MRSRFQQEPRSWILDRLFLSSQSRGDIQADGISGLDSAEAGSVSWTFAIDLLKPLEFPGC